MERWRRQKKIKEAIKTRWSVIRLIKEAGFNIRVFSNSRLRSKQNYSLSVWNCEQFVLFE